MLSELYKIERNICHRETLIQTIYSKTQQVLTTSYKFIIMGFSLQLDLIYINYLNNLTNSDFSNFRKGSVVLNGWITFSHSQIYKLATLIFFNLIIFIFQLEFTFNTMPIWFLYTNEKNVEISQNTSILKSYFRGFFPTTLRNFPVSACHLPVICMLKYYLWIYPVSFLNQMNGQAFWIPVPINLDIK